MNKFRFFLRWQQSGSSATITGPALCLPGPWKISKKPERLFADGHAAKGGDAD
jgi:hypothetical protein